MKLPNFKVTMLGGTEAGKTVFMASMYCVLRHGIQGISIRGVDRNQDLELDAIMQNIYQSGEFPIGTEIDDIRYEFELLLNEQPIARIDWVDYRGGLLQTTDTEHAKGVEFLTKRLSESHAIIWMVDLGGKTGSSLTSFMAKLETKIGIMANLCRNAIAVSNNIRSILFIRTKSDRIRNSHDQTDLVSAAQGLKTHLGENRMIHGMSSSAIIPVSSVGRLNSDNKPIGDDPSNVEWALILALGFMFEKEQSAFRAMEEGASRDLEKTKNTASSFFRDVLKWNKSEQEIQESERLVVIQRNLRAVNEIIRRLVKAVPPEILMFRKENP